jgi:hypothetical protein
MKVQMKILLGFLLVAAGAAGVSSAGEKHYDAAFFAGKYEIVGRRPDSNQTYSGTATISANGKKLKIVRSVNGRMSEGIGKFDRVTADEIPVIKISFREDGRSAEETCMFAGDVDNYVRMTCVVYGKATKKAGLETYFPNYGQLEK